MELRNKKYYDKEYYDEIKDYKLGDYKKLDEITHKRAEKLKNDEFCKRVRELHETPKKKIIRVRWDRVIGTLFVLFMIFTTIDILCSKPTIKSTPVGDYQCSGHLVKICSGSNETANYLGVE